VQSIATTVDASTAEIETSVSDISESMSVGSGMEVVDDGADVFTNESSPITVDSEGPHSALIDKVSVQARTTEVADEDMTLGANEAESVIMVVSDVEAEDTAATTVAAVVPVVVRVTPPGDFIDASIEVAVDSKGQVGDMVASSPLVAPAAGPGSTSTGMPSGFKFILFIVMLALMYLGYWLWSADADDGSSAEQRALLSADIRGRVERAKALANTQGSLREVLRIEDENLLLRVEREVMETPSLDERVTIPAAAGQEPNEATDVVNDVAQLSVQDLAQDQSLNDSAADAAHVGLAINPPLSSTPAGSGLIVVRHVVVSGDTLWHIAKRYLGDPYRYPRLAQLSQIDNPDLIYPGDMVTIEYQGSE